MPHFDLVALIKAIGYIGVTVMVFAESGLLIGFSCPATACSSPPAFSRHRAISRSGFWHPFHSWQRCSATPSVTDLDVGSVGVSFSGQSRPFSSRNISHEPKRFSRVTAAKRLSWRDSCQSYARSRQSWRERPKCAMRASRCTTYWEDFSGRSASQSPAISLGAPFRTSIAISCRSSC